MAPPNNYSNPLLQTSTLLKSFQKGPPKKTCGKCRCSHNHGECPAFGTVCSGCGKKNYWVQQCRTGSRHSLSGHTLSPGSPQKQRQRRHSSGKQLNKGRGHGEGGQYNKNSTPKKPGAGQRHGRSHKINSLTVAGNLSGPPHSPKVDCLGKEVVSIKADLSGPAHPPKTTGEQFSNTFVCDDIRGNGNEEYNLISSKSKAYTDTDSDGKTQIITDITCKFDGKLWRLRLTLDLRQTVYH